MIFEIIFIVLFTALIIGGFIFMNRMKVSREKLDAYMYIENNFEDKYHLRVACKNGDEEIIAFYDNQTKALLMAVKHIKGKTFRILGLGDPNDEKVYDVSEITKRLNEYEKTKNDDFPSVLTFEQLCAINL